MEGARWKGQVNKSNLLIFKRTTCIPTYIIRIRKITQISVGAIIKMKMLIKVCNKANKLCFKGNHHSWRETLYNFIKVAQSRFDQVNKNHEIMSRNYDASIKKWRCRLVNYPKKIVVLPSSCEGFIGNIVDNPKNESCNVVEPNFRGLLKMVKLK